MTIRLDDMLDGDSTREKLNLKFRITSNEHRRTVSSLSDSELYPCVMTLDKKIWNKLLTYFYIDSRGWGTKKNSNEFPINISSVIIKIVNTSLEAG